MEIRTVEIADAPALEPLFAQWGHPLGADEVVSQIRRWHDAPGAEFYVALLDGEIAGMAAVAAAPHLGRLASTAKLMGLVVSDRHRRQGVARSLLDAVTRQARVWGCDQIELTSSRARDVARAFYLALGYRDGCGTHAMYVRSLASDARR
jgi:GNAT superfamily N-acetyltransferase